MTVTIIDLNECKRLLRVDHSDDDTMLDEMRIMSATRCLQWIKRADESNLTDVEKGTLRSAIILMMARMYDRTEGKDNTGKDDEGYLSRSVEILLWPLRKPTLA